MLRYVVPWIDKKHYKNILNRWKKMFKLFEHLEVDRKKVKWNNIICPITKIKKIVIKKYFDLHYFIHLFVDHTPVNILDVEFKGYQIFIIISASITEAQRHHRATARWQVSFNAGANGFISLSQLMSFTYDHRNGQFWSIYGSPFLQSNRLI